MKAARFASKFYIFVEKRAFVLQIENCQKRIFNNNEDETGKKCQLRNSNGEFYIFFCQFTKQNRYCIALMEPFQRDPLPND